mmetsp:Transcript_42297/g.73254  ORF Transcript_42297/g.73254 Transcript_42297/m.73254 type:complete len:97 (+) Transcript_42297:66-356(+)
MLHSQTLKSHKYIRNGKASFFAKRGEIRSKGKVPKMIFARRCPRVFNKRVWICHGDQLYHRKKERQYDIPKILDSSQDDGAGITGRLQCIQLARGV